MMIRVLFDRAVQKKLFSTLILFFASVILVFGGGSPVDWPVLGFTQVVTNTFIAPICITHAGDNSQRLFVVQQPGSILIIKSNSVLTQPFLNITNRVLSTGTEQGLLGLAFPPGFSTNQHFYVDYTRQTDGAVVISRFQLTSNTNVADTNSEQILLVIPKSYNYHNAGQLAFGPDGFLYIGVGDGGPEGDPLNIGQKTSTLLGKILRIDVESGVSPYAAPINNPFVGNTNYAPEIWALGLRNPWRFSFDRSTGDLYIGDVGQNLYEEVDFQAAGSAGGQNYGWSIMEGPTNYNVPSGFTNFLTLTLPVAWYNHLSLPTDVSGAVIGGYVYRGPSVLRMNGVYFYGDFEAGWIWGLKQVGTNWQNLTLLAPSVSSTTFAISTFGEDDQGSLYLADYYKGIIYQVKDSLQVWAPTFSPTNGIINSSNVVVSCLTTGVVIHFTSNGVDPISSDPVVASGGTIPVTTGTTNKLRAFRSDLMASTVSTAIFTNQVGTPVFSPPAGPIPTATSVIITSVTTNAGIYYTTNGIAPTTNSLIYSVPLILSGGITLKAIGAAAGYNNSAVASASYSSAQAATPVFTPSSGPITNGTSIAISCTTPGAVIYYTLDGSTPTTNSSPYSIPFIINGGITVNAFAVANRCVNSTVKSVFYSLVQTATPLFTPASGPVTNGTSVTISCATPGSTVYYTLDGSPPTTNATVYSGGVTINGGTTLSAFAVADQHLDSAIHSVFYQLVQTATPVFSPISGPVDYGSNVSITCATPGSTIYYTLDGGMPTTSSAVYSGPLTITGDVTLSAYAVAYGNLDSVVRSTLFTLTQAAIPAFNPPQGPLTNGTLISIGTTTSNGAIRYTTDGSDPGTSSNAYTYSYSLSFTNPLTLTARTYRSDLDPSDARVAFFGLLDYENTVVTTVVGTTMAGFSNAVGRLASFSSPEGICIDKSGNLYVADTGNNVIRKISPSGQATTFAGTGIAGFHLGQATNAQFSGPTGVGVDTFGTMYVADGNKSNLVYRIDTNGLMTLLAITHQFGNSDGLWQLHLDAAGNVYAGSWGSVVRISPNGTVLGMGGVDSATCYNGWCPRVAPAVDAATNIYAATGNMIWKISSTGSIQAFTGTSGGFSDGPRLTSLFQGPQDVFVDSVSNIFVSDFTRIRKIRPDGWVSTMAGTGISGYQNGRGSIAQFYSTAGLCVDTNGIIYVVDSGNNCIRQISPDSYRIGIADWWQLAHFGYIGIDPNADPDHDGMSNYAEFWAGTDPLDPNSALRIDRTSLINNGHVQIRWQTVAGKTYAVQYSTDLISWNNLGSSIQGDGSIASVNDQTAISQNARRFYRINLIGF